MNLEWFEWTRHNLQRGCSPSEIKSILKNNGFSDDDILVAMSCTNVDQWNERRLQTTSPETDLNSTLQNPDLDYHALAHPHLLSHEALVSADKDHVQLYSIPEFLSRAECETLISIINRNLRPSTITAGEDKTGFRTSSTCDLGDQKVKAVAKIDKKIARALGMRLSWSEVIQGQKYEVGQEFKAHTDYFEPETDEFQTYAAELGQRTWTFMIYLNNTPEGGQTQFPKLDLEFRPSAGMAVIWNNLKEDGSPNPLTLHRSVPVKQGTKYIITKWFRAKGQGKALL